MKTMSQEEYGIVEGNLKPSLQFYVSDSVDTARTKPWKDLPRHEHQYTQHRGQNNHLLPNDISLAAAWATFEEQCRIERGGESVATCPTTSSLRRSFSENDSVLDHHSSIRHQMLQMNIPGPPTHVSSLNASNRALLAYPSIQTTSYEVNMTSEYGSTYVLDSIDEGAHSFTKVAAMVNVPMATSNTTAIVPVPLIEATFVDPRKCPICDKRISRDMIRHMWTHKSEKRFNCVFPKSSCHHKSGSFNRRYDFKKHLLNRHFLYDDMVAKREHNLSRKLSQWGTCPCGRRFISGDWLEDHILTTNESKKCPLLCEHKRLT